MLGYVMKQLFAAVAVVAALVGSQTCVAFKLTANRRFVDTDLACDGALRQTSFLQRINLVTLTFSEAVIGAHSCSFTLDGERHSGIAA